MSTYLVVAGDFVKTGGMDRANYALARYLAKTGHETHLVAYRVDSELAAMPNVVIHRVPKLANSYLLGEPLLDRVGRWWASRIAGGGGRVIVNGGNCNWPDANWVHYVHAAWRPIDTAQSLSGLKIRVRHRYALARERRAIGRARLIIVNSNCTRRDLEQRLGIDPHRIRTVYLGTDSDVFRPPARAERAALRAELGWGSGPMVAFVGALGDRRKGFDVLFEAWSALCRQVEGWDAKLVVIGAGAELERWRHRARQSGLEGRIEFMGFRRDVPKLLRACDALVAPARYEAYGLGVHEALCCGLPALVSAHAGVAERYPAALRQLLLQDPEDTDDLARRLLAWHTGRVCWRERVAPFSSELRRHGWDDMARDMMGVLNGIK